MIGARMGRQGKQQRVFPPKRRIQILKPEGPPEKPTPKPSWPSFRPTEAAIDVLFYSLLGLAYLFSGLVFLLVSQVH